MLGLAGGGGNDGSNAAKGGRTGQLLGGLFLSRERPTRRRERWIVVGLGGPLVDEDVDAVTDRARFDQP